MKSTPTSSAALRCASTSNRLNRFANGTSSSASGSCSQGRPSGAKRTDENDGGRLRVDEVAQDESCVDDVEVAGQVGAEQVQSAVLDVGDPSVVRLCSRDLELAFVEVDAEDAPGGRPAGELERDVASA